jgi:hypothetical protein
MPCTAKPTSALGRTADGCLPCASACRRAPSLGLVAPARPFRRQGTRVALRLGGQRPEDAQRLQRFRGTVGRPQNLALSAFPDGFRRDAVRAGSVAESGHSEQPDTPQMACPPRGASSSSRACEGFVAAGVVEDRRPEPRRRGCSVERGRDWLRPSSQLRQAGGRTGLRGVARPSVFRWSA